jgi:hypothetical protein
VAEPFAFPACLSADRAVLVLLGVPLAFVSTGAAGQSAGFEHRAQRGFIAAGAAGRHRASGPAGVGTVQVQPDALGQLLDHVLTKAGVGAGDTGLFAIEAGFYAADENIVRVAPHVRVGADHLLGVHGILLPLGR